MNQYNDDNRRVMCSELCEDKKKNRLYNCGVALREDQQLMWDGVIEQLIKQNQRVHLLMCADDTSGTLWTIYGQH
jgi:hypothetical protein